jgi:hypothetical protein
MKKTLIALLILLLLILPPVFSQQKRIVEEVSVDWWVIPIFAVDKSGQSVPDLKESDIVLKVDDQEISSFVLVKESFTVSGQPGGEEKERVGVSPMPVRKKNIFLLFDTALSTLDSTKVAKAIAQRIVHQAEPDTRFFVMTIEPFAGLTYVGGQTSDKEKLTNLIEEKVKGKPNSRVPRIEEILGQVVSGRHSKYTEADILSFMGSISRFYRRKCKSFVQSFESLYYALNAIKDTKVIYLFTEGISNAVQEAESGDRSLYRQYLSEMADYLGRSGSVLFIINPFGGPAADQVDISGEDSLRFLAQNSGGKYLDGSDKKLVTKIDDLNRAYYEIAFPAVPKSRAGILKISLQSKRKDIEIHTLKTAEKSRQYSQMKAVEQEVLALNLVSGNPLYKSNVSSQPAPIVKTTKKKKKTTYQVNIPDRFLNRSLDLYKIWLNPKDTRVEKESLQTNKKQVKITFNNVKPGENTFFVLMAGEEKSALVHGMKQEEQKTYAFDLPEQIEEWADKGLIDREKQSKESKKDILLDRLLQGAADYCEKLKQAAFHYLCIENISENQCPLTYRANVRDDVTADPGHPLFTQPSGSVERETIDQIKIYKNQFNYRLKKIRDQVKEEREVAAGLIDIEQIRKNLRFLSSKAVFAPITLLDTERENNYHFRMLGTGELKGRSAAIIEAYPKNEKDAQFIYGKIWIDREDFSILKIKANPNSILGYDKLEKLAEQLNTRVFLNLETEFFEIRDGIRFPTHIHFEESYKGGPFISKYRGSRKWIRTDTLITYSDYLFFKVDMDVVYQ